MPHESLNTSYARETSAAIGLLAAIAVMGVLFVGRSVMMPIVLALALTSLFMPVIRAMEARGVPAAAAAPAVIIVLLGGISGVMLLLAPSVTRFANQGPATIEHARERLNRMQPPFNALTALLPGGSDSAGPSRSAATGRGDASDTSDVNHRSPAARRPIFGRVFGSTADLATGSLQTLLLVIFLLAGGSRWRRKIQRGARRAETARDLIRIGGLVQTAVARYLLLTTLINIGQGAVVGLAMWGIGMPAPLAWGVMTFLAEFLPYLGGLTMVILLTLTGLASTHSTERAILAPIIYLIVTTVQNNVVSPVVYGDGLDLNPAAILISVVVWWFVWGVGGAFLAVPILATLKIVCDQFGGRLASIGELIGG